MVCSPLVVSEELKRSEDISLDYLSSKMQLMDC